MKFILSFVLLFLVVSISEAKKSHKKLRGKAKYQVFWDKVNLELSDSITHTFDTLLISDEYLCNIADDTVEILFFDTIVQKIQDTIVIAGVGDIMPGTNFPGRKYLPPNDDCYPLFSDVLSELAWQDIVTGNLEGVLAGNIETVKKCQDTNLCYAFRIPDHYLGCVLDAGFDFLSVANNHVGDFGEEGRQRMSAVLEGSNVNFSGFRSHPYTILKKDGIKYGFIGMSTSGGTNDFSNYSYAKPLIMKVDSMVDILIISIHGGCEGAGYQHVTKEIEVFYGQNRGNIYEFAHLAIDWGADIIFGHGPHVTRAVEVYKNRFVAYSLGNFCTYARFNLQGPNGIAPLINVYTDRKGRFYQAKVVSTRQIGEGGTRIDPYERAYKKILELTNADFPGHQLLFENGFIREK
ncbi:CapA family protein [Bacteroidales bacterium]|nr:CapA family protein [Bacteroidales bacterium]